MNYTKQTAGGTILTYPIEQITVTINNGQLQKLNSTPVEIIPAGFYYNVINATLIYNNVNLNTGFNLFIGYEPQLGPSNGFSSFCDYDTAQMGLNRGCISLGTRTRNLWTDNSLNTSPLVLWQPADDPSANYNQFDLTITYLKFP